MEFKQREVAVPISIGEIVQTTLRNRVSKMEEELMRQMTTNMWGDRIPLPKLTRWQKVKRKVSLYRERARDAWLVLIGREQIGGDY